MYHFGALFILNLLIRVLSSSKADGFKLVKINGLYSSNSVPDSTTLSLIKISAVPGSDHRFPALSSTSFG